MRRTSVFMLLLIACPIYGQAAAQDSIPAQVPRELVEMLAQSPTGGSVRVLVGELPPELSALLRVPRESRVVGSILYNMLSTSGVVFAEEAGADRLLDQWQTQLVTAGWKPVQEAGEEPQTGFLSTPRNSSRRSNMRREPLCAPDGRAVIQFHEGGTSPGDSTAVVITRMTGYAADQCDGETSVRRERPAIDLPTLRAPNGSTMQGSGWTGGGDPDARGMLRTTMNVDSILTHYATQMTEQGWAPQPPAVGPNTASQIFSKTNAAGLQWKGVLTVADIQSNQKALHLRIYPIRSR